MMVIQGDKAKPQGQESHRYTIVCKSQRQVSLQGTHPDLVFFKFLIKVREVSN